MNINKIKMWLEKSVQSVQCVLSVLKTHWSAGTNVHLNRNKTNYKSSLGMGIGAGTCCK
jgi:Zn ribbon nucleic-acid-binding protein